jgi:DNA-binding beta-propeller fold protein YncE
VLPQLRRLEEAFAGRLVVLGVHSPKFLHERDTAALRQAVARLGVRHPVANDRDFAVWEAYAVRCWPTLVFVDPEGRVLGRHEGEFPYEPMADAVAELLRRFEREGRLVRGDGLPGPTEPLPDTAHGLAFPGKAVASPQGYAVSDTGHHRVLLVDREGRVARVFGGPEPGFRDGPGEAARFRSPQGLAWLGGDLLVADTGNHALRAVRLPEGVVETLAGDGHQGPLWASPWDVACAGEQVFVAMAGNHRIAIWDAAHPRGAVWAGTGEEGLQDGPRDRAAFAQPSGLAVAEGVLYVADSETSAVRAVDLATGTTRTLVGVGLFDFGDVDGVGEAVRLQHCLGVAWLDGTLFVADSYNHRVKRLDPATRACRSWAGAGQPGWADGVGEEALFSEPGGIAAAHGELLVADTNNHCLRLVDPATRAVRTLWVRLPEGGCA